MDKPVEAPDVDYSTLTPKQFFLSVMRGEEQLDYDPELQMRIVRPPTFKERFAAASSVINYEHQRLMSSQVETTVNGSMEIAQMTTEQLKAKAQQLLQVLNKSKAQADNTQDDVKTDTLELSEPLHKTNM